MIDVNQFFFLFFLPHGNRGILSLVFVCLRRISSETAERIRLKFCTGTEVCLRHFVSHFDAIALGQRVSSEEPKMWFFLRLLCFSLAAIISSRSPPLGSSLRVFTSIRSSVRLSPVCANYLTCRHAIVPMCRLNTTWLRYRCMGGMPNQLVRKCSDRPTNKLRQNITSSRS